MTKEITVGRSGDEVVIMLNHPGLKVDVEGFGHLAFSPSQARAVAAQLVKHADDIEGEVADLLANYQKLVLQQQRELLARMNADLQRVNRVIRENLGNGELPR